MVIGGREKFLAPTEDRGGDLQKGADDSRRMSSLKGRKVVTAV